MMVWSKLDGILGEGRTVPPLSHEEFKKAWITWIKTGAYAPKQ